MAKITFTEVYNLRGPEIKLTRGIVGIYFVFVPGLAIPYPFGTSTLVYVGMSESQQNSIGKRLRSHLTGQSGNEGIKNYAEHHTVKFTYHSLAGLGFVGTDDLFDIERFFLTDFLNYRGSYPICNGQGGVERDDSPTKMQEIDVDWRFFEQ